jgi:hypothetical protein
LQVPRNRWTDGGWNKKLPQFLPLARWMGIHNPNPSPDELQVLFKAVAPKLFAESVPMVLEATGMKEENLRRNLMQMWGRLGLGSPIPPRSLKYGCCDPSDLEGSVAFVLGGTTGWMKTRLDRTLLAASAGAKFEHIIMLGSSRRCSAPADRRTPFIRDNFAEGEEPTESGLLKQWAENLGSSRRQFVFPEMPESEKPLSHMRRMLGLDDIWFSQPATDVVSPVPSYWWPEHQDLMTTPSGITRLWIELKANGCIS